jgi:alkanesulfonate monooxygenase SsuD/methylene tetrahydromethanopterin reductase-like flavin-dependent oxidoreductase (luciferase family)
MLQRLGLGVIPGAGWKAEEIRQIAQEAEQANFDSIFVAEVNNDALTTALLMGEATRRIRVGTWVANIYLRHPYVCAQAAALIADATGGRMVLGLGISHQPINQALGIAMPEPTVALREYAEAVTCWLRGEGPVTHLAQRPSSYPVPIHLGGLTSPTVELAGEIADGLMPLWWSVQRVARSRVWIERGRARSGGKSKLEVTLGLPTFVGDDIAGLRQIARANLGLFTTLPFFQRLMRTSGFATEAAQAEQGAGGAALSDRLLDEICLIGPVSRCRQRLAEYLDAGLDLPILWPAAGVDAARAVIQAFRQ